jgi:membrane associated rhomboid family serine protease/Flp pilus assembly protein TadD
MLVPLPSAFFTLQETCYHFLLMPLQSCATCGKEFDPSFSASPRSPNCPACDQQQAHRLRAAFPPPPRASISPAPFPVTISLIAACALVYVAMVLSGVSPTSPTPEQAIKFGADFGPLTLNGQWWRLVTSMFVHFGIIHIALNMWCLWNLGRAAEQLLGRFSYLLAYFAAGIFGSIASVYWHPESAGAGASGAIFGLAGVLVAFVYLKKTPAHLQVNSRMLGSLGTFIAYNLVFGAAIPGISNAAHIGGLVMGFAVGALLPNASVTGTDRRGRLSLITVLIAIVLSSSAYAAKLRRAGPDVRGFASIQELVKSGKTDEALAQLEQLTAQEPDLAPAQALLASLYFGKSRYSEGVAALQKAYDAEPNNPVYQQQLGGAYLNLGEYDQAIAFFQKLAAQNPNDAHTYLGLGLAYIGEKQLDPAIAAFRQSAALDPKSATPQHALGQAQLQAGHFADAQQTYRRLLTQFPSDARAKAALAYATQQLH